MILTNPAFRHTENDSHLGLSPDDAELWFNRTYQGTHAVYRSNLKDGAWQLPELVISQFAGEPPVEAFGNLYFVHHSYRGGKMLEADVNFARRKGEYYVEGI